MATKIYVVKYRYNKKPIGTWSSEYFLNADKALDRTLEIRSEGTIHFPEDLDVELKSIYTVD